MRCYGVEYGKNDKCNDCKSATWCKEAADLPCDSRCGVDLEEVAGQIKFSIPPAISEIDVVAHEKKEYTRNDLLEIISFMLSLDEKTLELLDHKIRDPDVRFSDIARTRQVSRQAVHKQILKKCRQIPELEIILRNRRKKIHKQKQTTFMKAVCQIRRKMSEQRSKKPSKNLKSSGRLTCLTQNLDLSRMSIFKGGGSLNHAWKNRKTTLVNN